MRQARAIRMPQGPSRPTLRDAPTSTSRAAAEPEALGGAAAVDRDLEVIGAAEQRARPRRRRIGVGRRRRRAIVRRPTSIGTRAGAASARTSRRSMLVIEVAEAIDAQHLARQHRRRRDCGCGHVEPLAVGDGRPERGRASMPFASHAAAGANRSRPSNVRLTVGRAYRALGQLHDRASAASPRRPATARRCPARRTGSRRPRRRCRAAPSRRPDRRPTRKMVPGRKVAVAGRELERAGQHVVRRDVVGDVDERRRPGRCRAPRPSSCRRSGRAVPKSVSSAMTRTRPWRRPPSASRSRRQVRRLAEQDLAQVVLAAGTSRRRAAPRTAG